MIQKTTIPCLKNIKRDWYLIDLEEKTIGREAEKVVKLLRGKNNKIFLPNLDLGNYVILTNAKYILLNKKKKKKIYYRHSGYKIHHNSLEEIIKDNPKKLIKKIISGMMPHSSLARKQLKRLFIYPDSFHRHKSQQKEIINLS